MLANATAFLLKSSYLGALIPSYGPRPCAHEVDAIAGSFPALMCWTRVQQRRMLVRRRPEVPKAMATMAKLPRSLFICPRHVHRPAEAHGPRCSPF